MRRKTGAVEVSRSKGSLEGEGLNGTQRIRGGATGAIILEQDLVGECGSTKWRRIQYTIDGEMGITRCSGLCKDIGNGSLGIQHGGYRKVSISFLFILIQKACIECFCASPELDFGDITPSFKEHAIL